MSRLLASNSDDNHQYDMTSPLPIQDYLRLVSANDGEKTVVHQESAAGRVGKEVRAAANGVVRKVLDALLRTVILRGVGP